MLRVSRPEYPVGEFRIDPEVVVPDGALAEGGINPAQLYPLSSARMFWVYF